LRAGRSRFTLAALRAPESLVCLQRLILVGKPFVALGHHSKALLNCCNGGFVLFLFALELVDQAAVKHGIERARAESDRQTDRERELARATEREREREKREKSQGRNDCALQSGLAKMYDLVFACTASCCRTQIGAPCC